MGIMKTKMEDYESRGFGEVPEKYVCQDCVNDEQWKEWIRQQALNRGRHACSYGDKRLATISLEEFISHCMEFINANYDRTWEDWGIKEDEETGEYSVETWDTWDLVHEELAEEAGIEHEELLRDIANSIHDTVWCEHDPFD